ncbi:MAG: hypothetical protein CFH01_00243 [Alphaproteobacteria bacterium MarineAlpha2_Bin1]|nr:MAG: hypothetical protein CFH01_00243 [Alphaproteobacteria bacterium MarineAlpha2_Bin1]
MDWHSFWVLLHLLTFVYWVGADLGVFYSARLVVNPNYSFETRLQILKLLGWIDMIPRYMLLLTFPIGLTLSYSINIGPQSVALLLIVHLIFVLWVFLVFKIHKEEGSLLGSKLAGIDLYLRLVFIILLISLCLYSIIMQYPFKTDWLIIKIILFSCTIICGVGIRITFKPFMIAFMELSKNGSSVKIEDKMRRSLNHAVPFVIGIWIFAGLAAFIGLSHERLF